MPQRPVTDRSLARTLRALMQAVDNEAVSPDRFTRVTTRQQAAKLAERLAELIERKEAAR